MEGDHNPEWEKLSREKPQRLFKVSEDRLPPHSTESEQGILGCIFLEPLDCIEDCLEHLPSSEVFYDLRHRSIYEAMLDLYQRSVPIEIISVMQVLKDRQQLEGIGGIAYLASLPDVVPSAANLDYYVGIVCEKFTLRNIINTGTEIAARAYEYQGEVGSLVDEIELDLETALGRRKADEARLDAAGCLAKFTGDLERRISLAGTRSGVVTGFVDLDDLTDGLQHGEQFVIGARPSIGKTAIGLNLFLNACVRNKVPTLFVSLEQSTAALMRRMVSSFCRIDMRNLKRGTMTDEEMDTIVQFNLEFHRSPAFIYDFVSTGASAPTIASVVKRAARRNGVKLIIIDYLQKVRPAERHEKRTYEVAEVSGILRAAAVASNVAMVTLAQLNRENEKEKGRAPRLTDLADSGQIERDADMVGLLHRDRSNPDGPAQLAIAKQRDGEIGIVNLHFTGRYCQFNNGTYNREEPQ